MEGGCCPHPFALAEGLFCLLCSVEGSHLARTEQIEVHDVERCLDWGFNSCVGEIAGVQRLAIDAAALAPLHGEMPALRRGGGEILGQIEEAVHIPILGIEAVLAQTGCSLGSGRHQRPHRSARGAEKELPAAEQCLACHRAGFGACHPCPPHVRSADGAEGRHGFEQPLGQLRHEAGGEGDTGEDQQHPGNLFHEPKPPPN